jgi:two-component system, OmpR family, response regulator
MRLLIVEDEARLADAIRRASERDGWAVDIVGNGEDAIWYGSEYDYDAIVLDVGIPSPDGFEVCRTLRQSGRWAPILFLTARDAIVDRVVGLDAGADDYLTKPFALDELAARLRALSRRTLGERPAMLVAGDLTVDAAAHTVERSGVQIELSAKEFAVLKLLIRQKGQVVSRTELLDHAWDGDYGGTSNIVDVYVAQLRSKIDRPFDLESIVTIRGVGYRLDEHGGVPVGPSP